MQSGAEQLKRLIFALLMALYSAASPLRAEPSLRLLSNVTWEWGAKWFGGFSGIELSPNGTRMTLLSDRGRLVEVKLWRENNILVGLEPLLDSAIFDRNGKNLSEDYKDIEGLAIARDGTAYASFERQHRIARLNLKTGRTHDLPGHPDFDALRWNKGFEALAVHPDGRLFTLSEGEARTSGTTPLYAFVQGRWQITHHIPLRRPFRPVGADFDERGRLYLLERTMGPLGFRSRIRRLDLNASPARLQTLLVTTAGQFDNLEGLGVWRDSTGATRLTLVSDDNFMPFQKTQIIEFLLTE